jgi:hypothetical protein
MLAANTGEDAGDVAVHASAALRRTPSKAGKAPLDGGDREGRDLASRCRRSAM